MMNSAFIECRHCGATLTPAHKISSQVVPDSPQHLALVLKCNRCGKHTKLVSEIDVWTSMENVQREARRAQKKLLANAHEAVAEAENITWLLESWSKHAPLREEVMGSCGCRECKERIYAPST